MKRKRKGSKPCSIDRRRTRSWAEFKAPASTNEEIELARNIAEEAKNEIKRLKSKGCESAEQLVAAELRKLMHEDDVNRFLALADLPESVIAKSTTEPTASKPVISYSHFLVLTRLTRITPPKRKTREEIIQKVFDDCVKERWSCKRLQKEVSAKLSRPPRPLQRISKLNATCDSLASLLESSAGVFDEDSISRIKSRDVERAVAQAEQLAERLDLLRQRVPSCRKEVAKAKRLLSKRIPPS